MNPYLIYLVIGFQLQRHHLNKFLNYSFSTFLKFLKIIKIIKKMFLTLQFSHKFLKALFLFSLKIIVIITYNYNIKFFVINFIININFNNNTLIYTKI